jgi:hypothetical protein
MLQGWADSLYPGLGWASTDGGVAHRRLSTLMHPQVPESSSFGLTAWNLDSKVPGFGEVWLGLGGYGCAVGGRYLGSMVVRFGWLGWGLGGPGCWVIPCGVVGHLSSSPCPLVP